MTAVNIKENLSFIKQRIEEAAIQAGRDPESVKLIAVSKTKPVELIEQAYDYGQRHFGENKVQEIQLKAPQLSSDINWHHIGHLQSNKVKPAVQYSDLIHAVDSLKLLQRINRIAGEQEKTQAILLQLNISGEESKFGLSVEQLNPVLDHLASCPNISCQGFMTMAPFAADSQERLAIFQKLAAIRLQAEKDYSSDFPELSMGMTGDFAEAIAAGATYIRIGTAIFGAR